jgi:hypothetical protein
VSRYHVTVTREGRWWVADVEGVGVTQAKSLAELQEMTVDLIEAVSGKVPKNVQLEFSVVVEDVDVTAQLEKVRAEMAELAQRQRQLANASRHLARQLSRAGASGADIARVMDISPQRVSQLLH